MLLLWPDRTNEAVPAKAGVANVFQVRADGAQQLVLQRRVRRGAARRAAQAVEAATTKTTIGTETAAIAEATKGLYSAAVLVLRVVNRRQYILIPKQ